MKFMLFFVGWFILFAISWPLAIAALILFPIIWLVLLPFRLVGIAIGAVFELLKSILFLPARLLRSKPAAQAR